MGSDAAFGNGAQIASAVIAVAAAALTFWNVRIASRKNASDFTLKLLDQWNGEKLLDCRVKANDWTRDRDKKAAETEFNRLCRERAGVPDAAGVVDDAVLLAWRDEATAVARHRAEAAGTWKLDLNPLYRDGSKEDREAALGIFRVCRFWMDLHILYVNRQVDRRMVRELFGPSARYWQENFISRLVYVPTGDRPHLFSEPAYYERWLDGLGPRLERDARSDRLSRSARIGNWLLRWAGVRLVLRQEQSGDGRRWRLCGHWLNRWLRASAYVAVRTPPSSR